jgi:hypothetical protein
MASHWHAGPPRCYLWARCFSLERCRRISRGCRALRGIWATAHPTVELTRVPRADSGAARVHLIVVRTVPPSLPQSLPHTKEAQAGTPHPVPPCVVHCPHRPCFTIGRYSLDFLLLSLPPHSPFPRKALRQTPYSSSGLSFRSPRTKAPPSQDFQISQPSSWYVMPRHARKGGLPSAPPSSIRLPSATVANCHVRVEQATTDAVISRTETVSCLPGWIAFGDPADKSCAQLNKYLKLDQRGSIIAEYVWIDSEGGTRAKARVSLHFLLVYNPRCFAGRRGYKSRRLDRGLATPPLPLSFHEPRRRLLGQDGQLAN